MCLSLAPPPPHHVTRLHRCTHSPPVCAPTPPPTVPQVRRTVIALLPRLAHFQPELFISAYLDKALAHLLASLKASTERPTAFMALGSVAVAVGDHKCVDALSSQLEEIIALLKDGLTAKRSKPFCPGASHGGAGWGGVV